MKTCRSFKIDFSSKYRHVIFSSLPQNSAVFLKLGKKKTEIGKYSIIKKYAMVYVHS